MNAVPDTEFDREAFNGCPEILPQWIIPTDYEPDVRKAVEYNLRRTYKR